MKTYPKKPKSRSNMNRRNFLRNTSLSLTGIMALKMSAFANSRRTIRVKRFVQE